MGYDITIHREGLRLAEFEASLGAFLLKKPLSTLWNISKQFASSALTGDGRYDLAARPSLWLAIEGSTRGVHLEAEQASIEITLQSGASKIDFGIARWLVRAALTCGAKVEDEAGAEITMAETEPEVWIERSERVWKTFWGMIKHSAINDSSSVTLPVGPLSYSISPEEFSSKSIDEIEAEMAAKMAHYGNTFIARVFKSTGPGGEQNVFSNYGLIPTLMQSEVPGVMVACESGVLIDEPIPVARFREIMGARCQEMNGYFYIEGIDPEKDSEVLLALTGKTPADIKNMTWVSAAYLPFAVWAMVALVDGDLDEKESKSLIQFLQQSAESSTGNAHFRVLSQILLRGMLRKVMDELRTKVYTLPQMFEIGGVALDRLLSPAECLSVKQEVYRLGETVAKASGGGLLGFGSKISKEEQVALNNIKSALGLA